MGALELDGTYTGVVDATDTGVDLDICVDVVQGVEVLLAGW